ncbi:tetratricopeptide repeat protein [Flavobacterium branchiicola]|uniref:Tetratricopeptide repeat protein n=1 Tax=Flavobacterium branchiicola TaxID=1114875 RepID=A0ABV9PLV2_9FLAO|nr:tetratricopeptide repeat protein [Flavobacterium branchiicola]MBS7256370.1 tetratricopeptide repeat protein [Flavobacterium branchiicola]
MFQSKFLLVKYIRLYFTVFYIVFGLWNSYGQRKNLTVKEIDSTLNSVNQFLRDSPNEGYEISKNIYQITLVQGYRLGSSLALLNMGNCKGKLRDYDKALNYLEKSKEIAQKISNDSLMLYADFAIAIQHGRMHLNKLALSQLDNCLTRVNCLDGKSKFCFLGRLYTFKASFSAGLKNKPTLEEFIELHKKASYYFSKNPQIPNYALINIGDTYMSAGKLDSAEYYFKEALLDYKKKKINYTEIILSNLAEVYYKKHGYAEAIAYLDKSTVLAKRKKTFYILEYNYGLYKKIAEEKGLRQQVLDYQKLELIYKDSTHIAEQKSMIAATNYVVSKAEVEKEVLINRSTILLLIAGFLIIGLLLYSYWQFCYKNKLKLDTQQKKKEIEQKTTQIVSLKKKVTTSYDEVIEMAKKNDPLFVVVFKELYPDFYLKLIARQPDLTITEQKICFYLKLKFSTKEIADYTFVTAKAIQNRKNRLRKRLFLEEGEDIYKYFDQ